MGNQISKNSGREIGVAIWILYIVVNQVQRAIKSHQQQRNQNENQKDTIKFTTGEKGAKKKVFTKTGGGKTDLSVWGAAEFWVSTGIRIIECYGMLKFGRKYFEQDQKTKLSPIHQLRNVTWAAFTLLPMLDLVMPNDLTNPTQEDMKKNRFLWKFRLPLYVWVALEMFSTVKAIQAIVHPKSKLSTLQATALMATVGLFNGAVGINVSHELLHQPSKFEKFLGFSLLANVNYMHWGDEHLEGHHEKVATPEDPATARLNESLYSFLPRTFFGSWLSAWQIEMKRIKENNLSKVFNNRMVAFTAIPFLWATCIAKLTGGPLPQVLKLFYLQGLGSALLLEMVNYVEHYGLTREKLPDGSYERVNPSHSWNSAHRVSNAFLYRLQRHSDHHARSMVPYHLLNNLEEVPTLPSGYPGMLVLALFPPVYRWIMNPLVRAAKVKPGESHFANHQTNLKQAERSARLKMAVFSTSIFSLGTYALYRSEKNRISSILRSRSR